MEILDSKILLIEGRQYINYYNDDQTPEDTYDDEEPPPSRISNNVSPRPTTTFKQRVPCPNALFRHVIGHRGQTIRRLQDETGATVEVPRGKATNGIIVTAKSESSLEAAITRIQLILSEKRWKEPFQHLITIPLTSQSIKNGVAEFKSEVLTKCGTDQGITERLFQDKNKTHLTIGTLVLLDDTECDKAVKVMQGIMDTDIIKSATEAEVSVNGIEYMNDDPRAVDVLYAKVQCREKPGVLEKIADFIVSEYVKAGLMRREHDHVKLHATIMNTIKTAEKIPAQEKGHRQNVQRETFDAHNVLALFQGYNFGSFPLREIHISRRYTADESGYYESMYTAQLQ